MNQMVIRGVSSQTFVAANFKRTEDFYGRVLGLPIVKRTVHHHDVRLPIITFGFQSLQGEPQRGETITYIEWNPIF